MQRPSKSRPAPAKGRGAAELAAVARQRAEGRDFLGAIAAATAALRLRPDNPDALYWMTSAYMSTNDGRRALVWGRRLYRLHPGHFPTALLVAKLLTWLGILPEAGEVLDRIDPAQAGRSAEYYFALGRFRSRMKQVPAEIEAYEQCVRLNDRHWLAHLYCGSAYQLAGDLDAAITATRRAAEINPSPKIGSSIVILRDFDPASSMADVAAERRAWNRRYGAPSPIARHDNVPDPGRRLAIGYLSSYFYECSGARIFSSVIARHDRAAFDVFCYSSGAREDGLTARVRSHSHWRAVAGHADAAVADAIRRDGIDILVDADGHSPDNRLSVLALKPAPLQVTGWGHAGGTGMTAIDYALVDPVFAPASDQCHYAERLLNLPCVLTVEPPLDAPPPGPLPAAREGYLTFGCLNRLTKVTTEVIALWCEILAAVPGSRFLLKGRELGDAARRLSITAAFARHGIPAERLVLAGGSSHREHLATYNQVDIALDPFPMSGGVTAVEGMRMGVPVVVLYGRTMIGRVSSAALSSVGKTGWIARTKEEYRTIALGLAGDLQALEAIRQRLPGEVAAAPVGNPDLYTRSVESAFRTIWREWCAGLAVSPSPPTSASGC